MDLNWIDEMNESFSKHSKSSEKESSEPVAWIAAIVINAALVILFLSVVIYCYCKNKAKHEASRRQKIKNRIMADRNWQRVASVMKPNIISHNPSAGYSNVFSVEEQKYHDSLEDLPITVVPRNNTAFCSCSQHDRRDQQIKRNNWIPTEIREKPSVKNNQISRTNKTNREGIAWVDVNGKMTNLWGRTNISFNPALSPTKVPSYRTDNLR